MTAPLAILMYHRVAADDLDPFQLQVRADRFEEHLQVIRETAALAELEAATRPSPEPRVVVTFDDGYVDNLTVAKPLLERYGIPATVFVTSGLIGRDAFWLDRLNDLLLRGTPESMHLELELAGRPCILHVGTPEARVRAHWYLHHRLRRCAPAEIERDLAAVAAGIGRSAVVPPSSRPLTSDEVRDLARSDLVAIGAHTVNHAMLSSLGAEGQRAEMAGSRSDLEAIIERPVPWFAYPFGDRPAYDDTSVKLARELFDLALTSQPAAPGAPGDRYQMPRHFVGDWSGAEFRARLETWLRR